ncbi:hypothetical protein AGMMS49940_14680 [Spirochaetia bacterium]|nr:hypothetical protein AGMMS49940_14680 [Spirochaetia bacterium]
MNRKFILDKEINLKEQDFLKTEIYSKNLTELIKNTEKNRVFTIGLFGNWGTGKSSIIETSQKDFDQEKEKFIIYDAWQYCNDSFRRMFLRKLRDDLKFEETDLMKKFYENESTDIGKKYQISKARLIFILAAEVVILFLLPFFNWDTEFKLSIAGILALAGTIISVISGAFHQLNISVTKPHVFAPEQFEDCFKEIVANSLKTSSIVKKVLKYINADRSIKNLDKLVIVIDNIDRCSNDVAYQLLTDIKTFLGSLPYSIVFVIPVDDEALRKHILSNRNVSDDTGKVAEEFLRKFFNLVIRIKSYGETDMFAFAKQISKKNALGFRNETVNLAAKEYAKNPRRVIQLYNNLLAELNYYDSDFSLKNETLICSILILREEFPEYYMKILNSPKTFMNEVTSEETKNNDQLARFIRIAHNAIGKIDIGDLSKILTNSENIFVYIPDDIKDAINTFDSNKIMEVFKTNDEFEKTNIFDYLFHKMNVAIKNALYDTELINYFDLSCIINTQYPINIATQKRLYEIVQPFTESIIIHTSSSENLCIFAMAMADQGNLELKSSLISVIKDTPNIPKEELDVFQDYKIHLFNAILLHFHDAETSKDLSTVYNQRFDTVKDSVMQQFSQDQFNHLVSDEFVRTKIQTMQVFDGNSVEYKRMLFLFKNKYNISAVVYGMFFDKLVELQGDMRGKTREQIGEFLKILQPCIDFISDKKLSTEPQKFYMTITQNRGIPNPQRSNQPQFDAKANFIDECISTKQYVEDVIAFIVSMCRITNSGVNIEREVVKIMSTNRAQLNEKVIDLVNKGFNLHHFLGHIFADTNYSDTNTQVLLKHCFLQKNTDGTYLVGDDGVVKQKLNEILDFAHTNKSNDIYALLKSLTLNGRYKNILSSLIVGKDSSFINSIDKTLLDLAIGTFTQDNCIEYVDNFTFLSVIIKQGNVSQKKNVLNIIISKLIANQNIDETLNLIESITNVGEIDPVGLLVTHLKSFLNENKEIVSDDIRRRVVKIQKKLSGGNTVHEAT